MAMHDGAGHPINPANLWGKPDPRKPQKEPKESEQTVSRIDADEFDDEEIDVEEELETAIDDDEAYAETDDYEDEDSEDIRATSAKLTESETVEASDDYEHEFAPEEGDDDSPDAELEDDENNSADETDTVPDDLTEDFHATDKTPAATSSRKSKMPKTSGSAHKTSGSDHIRAEIARRQEAGEGLRGKDIVAALAARRVNVSPAAVSQILKKEGLSTGRKGRPKAAAVAGEEPTRPAAKVKGRAGVSDKKPAAAPERKMAPKVKPAISGSAQLPMDQLQAANAFVKACGNSFETASQILGFAEQISQTFGRSDLRSLR